MCTYPDACSHTTRYSIHFLSFSEILSLLFQNRKHRIYFISSFVVFSPLFGSVHTSAFALRGKSRFYIGITYNFVSTRTPFIGNDSYSSPRIQLNVITSRAKYAWKKLRISFSQLLSLSTMTLPTEETSHLTY